MYTTLVYEAQKAILDERVQSARRHQQGLSARRAAVRERARHDRRGRLPRVRAVFGMLALVVTAGLGFASSALADLPDNCSAGVTTVTCGYQYTGSEQAFTVPSGVDSVQVDAVGANGGGTPTTPGGAAATATDVLPVRPGEVLYIEVGGVGRQMIGPGPGGWNGGGDSPGGGGGGGGASDVRTIPCGLTCPGDPASLGSRLLVAGGGGGAGLGISAGAGGVADQVGAAAGGTGGGGGAAGTLAGGGRGGVGATSSNAQLDGVAGNDGTFGQGGAGSGDHSAYDGSGGGGGGGYFGGGGGGSGTNNGRTYCLKVNGITTCPSDPAGGAGGGGGGGGASYAPGGAIGVARVGDPAAVSITYSFPAASPSAQSVSFATQPQSTLSPSQPVSVTNTGGAPLRVTGLTFSGTNAGDFLVTSDDCRGNTIAAGNSCVVNVGFAPQGIGSRTATLVIESNDPLSPASVALSGTGAGPVAGPQGPVGPQGPIGATGPQGPAGPAGKVTCNNTLAAQLLCTVIFAPGTWSTAHPASLASYDITRHGRTIESGRIRVGHGRVTLRSRALPAGRYAVTVTVVTAHHRVTLLHRTVVIAGAS